MGVLSCLEVCNYHLMADCTQFGIQKLVPASETRNAGGASLPPICGLGKARLHRAHPPLETFREGRTVSQISKVFK